MNYSKYLLIGAVAILSVACSDDENVVDPSNETVVDKEVAINPDVTYQTIKGFGASDCWQGQWIGKYWTASRQSIANLLFSQDIENGKAKGIGLSMWRVNLGAGSAEQGDASGITTVTRRAESYRSGADGYDWTKCEGQRYFMQQAKNANVERIVLFANSPLVQYTYNGQARSDRGSYSNLKSEYYDAYAEYLATVAKHFEDEGYNISHISPINEPQYNWDGTDQEGSAWQNSEVAKLTRALDQALTDKGSQANILLGEAGDWEYIYSTKSDVGRSNLLNTYFNSSNSNYVADLNHVEKLIAGHSYWTESTWDGMIDVRTKLADACSAKGVEVWQSEWSMLGDNYSTSEYSGHDSATELEIAMYMSRVIHNDLTVAGVTTWSYWTAMDVPHYGHKNRFVLISLTPSTGEWGDVTDGDGSYTATPSLWVLGNYSRFIRPGYQRIALAMNDNRNFFASAYVSPSKDEVVVVYTNNNKKAVRLNDNLRDEYTNVKSYTTSSSKQLEEHVFSASEDLTVDAKSVTTLVYTK